ncbi:MAG: hypothetical protein RLZZ09_3098, partial [Pseudomonadota bacterium]
HHASLARRFGGSFSSFLQRGWVYQDGYLMHVNVPFLDVEEEVEVDIDELAGRYFYFSPKCRSRRVSRPLSEIAMYRIAVDRWLADLAELVGIRSLYQSEHRPQIPAHLWHLGDLRLGDSRETRPIFLGLRLSSVREEHLSPFLTDPIWSGPGLVLVHQARGLAVTSDHAVRGLHEFINRFDDTAFDQLALERLLVAAPPGGGNQVEQFIKDNRVKLPHFDAPREVRSGQFKIIRVMWGDEGLPPPEMGWSEVNAKVNSGYQSFDAAFGDAAARSEFLERVRRGRYRVRRKTIS